MSKRYHSNKEVHAVIDAAVRDGWRWVPNSGKNHVKGELLCAFARRGGCIVRVASTPRNPEGHAKKVARLVEGCPHEGS